MAARQDMAATVRLIHEDAESFDALWFGVFPYEPEEHGNLVDEVLGNA